MLTRDAALHYTYRFQTEILYWFHTAKEVKGTSHKQTKRKMSGVTLFVRLDGFLMRRRDVRNWKYFVGNIKRRAHVSGVSPTVDNVTSAARQDQVSCELSAALAARSD